MFFSNLFTRFMRIEKIFYSFLIISSLACDSQNSDITMVNQTELNNPKIKAHSFLDCMYQDAYFPSFLVDKCRYILLELCQNIESSKPATLEKLYELTHAATDKLNDLEDEFLENDSEIETGARDCLAVNFEFIATSYGFDADIEELVATRDW